MSNPKPPSLWNPLTLGRRILRKSSWWTYSVLLHGGFAFLIACFWVIRVLAPDEGLIVREPRRPVPAPEMEKPRDLDPSKKVLDMEKSVEDPVYRKNAEEADHTETADEEEFVKASGDSLDFVSDKPFAGKGTYDVVGGGGGGGGRYGQRLGGKRNLVARGGGGADTEDAVLAALKWLSRHQNADGSWKTQDYLRECRALAKHAAGGTCAPNPGHTDFDAGNTGLSLLAFLGAGYSHLSKDTYDGIRFGDVVRKGLQWMMAHQDHEGCVGDRNVEKQMYNHAISALALSEAYGLTGSNIFKEQAQKSIDFLVASQNPGKGWRYTPRSGESDTSVTGWAALALKSAELSGLGFRRSGYDGCRAWLDSVTEAGTGRVGYTHRGTGKVYVPGLNEQFDHHETLTAIGVMARVFMDRSKRDPRLSQGCDLLLKDLPRWEKDAIDFYYWYCASLAVFQYDGPSGPKWKAWNKEMKGALVKNQNIEPRKCLDGSWEPVGRWSGEGGRVYSTAINSLTLEVYYRYANVFGTMADAGGPRRQQAVARPKPPAPPPAMNFKKYPINPAVDTLKRTRSTFALDVDTGSYTMARNYIRRGQLPPAEAIRTEECLNYFRYGDEPPPDRSFDIRMEVAPSPFVPGYHLLRIAILAKELDDKDRKDVVLTFVVDVSGSMAQENRLGLVKKSLRLLVNRLRPTDRIGIVEYGDIARKRLDPTPVAQRARILDVIEALATNGSTNAEAGLQMGYEMAARVLDPAATNRVVLCSDGVANVGQTGPAAILASIKKHAKKGITLSTLGFGMGNYNDQLMEQLADKGDGNSAYIDTYKEAKRVMLKKLTGLLEVVGYDTKVQVQFDPRTVSTFRLVGYENRRVANKDFRNNKIDAGELGAGHRVTAMYELKLRKGVRGHLATVRFRYREPGTGLHVEPAEAISVGQIPRTAAVSSASFRLAASVMQYAEILRESPRARGITMKRVLEWAKPAVRDLDQPEEGVEFLSLLKEADRLGR